MPDKIYQDILLRQSQVRQLILNQFQDEQLREGVVISDESFQKAVEVEKLEVFSDESIKRFCQDIQKAHGASRLKPDELEKAKKDLSKLVKVTKMDKNGKKVTVWVKRGEEPKKERPQAKQGEEAPERSSDHQELLDKKEELSKKVETALKSEKDPDKRAELHAHAARLKKETSELGGKKGDSAEKKEGYKAGEKKDKIPENWKKSSGADKPYFDYQTKDGKFQIEALPDGDGFALHSERGSVGHYDSLKEAFNAVKPHGEKKAPKKKSEKVDLGGGDVQRNIKKLMDHGYSESDAEDFADEFKQGGNKISKRALDILNGNNEKEGYKAGDQVDLDVKKKKEEQKPADKSEKSSIYESHAKTPEESQAVIARQKSLLANPKSPAGAKRKAQEIIDAEEKKFPKAGIKKESENKKPAAAKGSEHEKIAEDFRKMSPEDQRKYLSWLTGGAKKG